MNFYNFNDLPAIYLLGNPCCDHRYIIYPFMKTASGLSLYCHRNVNVLEQFWPTRTVPIHIKPKHVDKTGLNDNKNDSK